MMMNANVNQKRRFNGSSSETTGAFRAFVVKATQLAEINKQALHWLILADEIGIFLLKYCGAFLDHRANWRRRSSRKTEFMESDWLING